MIVTAVIFDLNGTLLSDEDEYGKAFATVLKQFGVADIPEVPHTAGIGVAENWPKLIEKYQVKTDKSAEQLAIETQSAYESLLDSVTLQEGVIDFIKDLKESGIIVALGTSNTWQVVDKVIEKFELEGLFDAITTGEEVENKKPSPDIFLVTAEKLEVDPGKCLVFEDADAGIEAAHAAGMKVVGIIRGGGSESLEEADKTITSFKEMTPELVASI